MAVFIHLKLENVTGCDAVVETLLNQWWVNFDSLSATLDNINP